MEYQCFVAVWESVADLANLVKYQELLAGQDVTDRPGLQYQGGRLLLWSRTVGADPIARLLTLFHDRDRILVLHAVSEEDQRALVESRFPLGTKCLCFERPPSQSPEALLHPFALFARLSPEAANAELDIARPDDDFPNLFVAPIRFLLDDSRDAATIQLLLEDEVLGRRTLVIPPRPLREPADLAETLAFGPLAVALRSAIVSAFLSHLRRPAGVDLLRFVLHPLVRDAISEGATVGFAEVTDDETAWARGFQLVTVPPEALQTIPQGRLGFLLSGYHHGFWVDDLRNGIIDQFQPLLAFHSHRERPPAVESPTNRIRTFPLELFGPGCYQRLTDWGRARQLTGLVSAHRGQAGWFEPVEAVPAEQAGNTLAQLVAHYEGAWRRTSPASASFLLDRVTLPADLRELLIVLSGGDGEPGANALALFRLVFWPALSPYPCPSMRRQAGGDPLGLPQTFEAAFALLDFYLADAPGPTHSVSALLENLVRTFLNESRIVRLEASERLFHSIPGSRPGQSVMYFPVEENWLRILPLVHLLLPREVLVRPGCTVEPNQISLTGFDTPTFFLPPGLGYLVPDNDEEAVDVPTTARRTI